MKPALLTLALLVAKWLCQKSVSFSRSGWSLYSMRYSHQARACGPLFDCAMVLARGAVCSSRVFWPGPASNSRSIVLSGPSLSAVSSSAQVAANEARR